MLHCAVKITRPTALLNRKAKARGVCAGKVRNQTLLTHALFLAMTRAPKDHMRRVWERQTLQLVARRKVYSINFDL